MPADTRSERRHDARLPTTRPIKLVCTHSARRYAGRLVNLSASGALIDIDHPLGLAPGHSVRLGIAWTRRDAVLPVDHLLEARVVRNLGIQGRQQVAVAFTQRQEMAATA